MRYWVLSMLCVAALIAYVQRSAISVPAKIIQQELGMDAASMGLVMAVWYWGYALFQIPSGWLADYLGSRKALVFYAITWSIFTAIAGLATSYEQLLVFWCLMGIAQAGIFPASAKAIGAWFSDRGKAFASGLLASSMAVGGALAPALTAQLLTSMTWHQALYTYAIPGIVWATLFFYFTSDAKETSQSSVSDNSKKIDWMVLITSTSMWLLCAQQFLRAAAMVFFSTWFPRFLEETRGLTNLEAGRMTSWPGIGMMAGGLLGGISSEWIYKATGNKRLSRQGIAVAGMTICSMLFVTANYITDTNTSVFLMALGAFWAAFGGVSGYSVAIDFGGRNIATVFSTMNMCGNIGAGLFPLVVGRIIEKSHNWDFALFLFAGIFALDALIWSFLNPKGPLFGKDIS